MPDVDGSLTGAMSKTEKGQRPAVVVIDEQDPGIKHKNNQWQELVLRHARKLGCTIILVEMKRKDQKKPSPTKTRLKKASTPSGLLSCFKPQPKVIHKLCNNAFIGTGLEYTVQDVGADTIVLMGQAAGACIRHTAMGAKPILSKDGTLLPKKGDFVKGAVGHGFKVWTSTLLIWPSVKFDDKDHANVSWYSQI